MYFWGYSSYLPSEIEMQFKPLPQKGFAKKPPHREFSPQQYVQMVVIQIMAPVQHQTHASKLFLI